MSSWAGLTVCSFTRSSRCFSYTTRTNTSRFSSARSNLGVELTRARSNSLAEVTFEPDRDCDAILVASRLVLITVTRNGSKSLITALVPWRADFAFSCSFSREVVSAIRTVNTGRSVTANISGAVFSFRTDGANVSVDGIETSWSAVNVVPSPGISASESRRALVSGGGTYISLVASSNSHRVVEGVAYNDIGSPCVSHVIPSHNDLALNVS